MATQLLAGKVVFLGATGVGKTSIVTKATTNSFDQNQLPTIGGSFASKTYDLETDQIVMRIWDTAGQERFRSLTSMYYHDAHCAVIVFSLLSVNTFKEIDYWYRQLRDHSLMVPRIYIVGNKMDQIEARVVPYEEGRALADSIGGKYCETKSIQARGYE